MTYALPFNPDFLRGEAVDGMAHTPMNRPTSVAQALANLSDKTWSRLAREIFRCEPKFLGIEAVRQKVEETNTSAVFEMTTPSGPTETCVAKASRHGSSVES